MRWKNVPKDERRGIWPWAPPPSNDNVCEAHEWCNEQVSDGRFYHHYTNTRWWFEKPEDATMFALIWSGK